MSVDRGSTTLALWTRSRGAYAWPLPTGPEGGPAGPATMSTPAASSTLTGSTVTFTWYPSAAASAYWLDIGSSAGANNYYSSGNLGSALSTTVAGLPTNGSTVYATLYSLVNGNWQYNSYTYTAFNAGAETAALTTPPPSTTLAGSTITFSWNAGTASPKEYWLDIGSSAGANNYYSSGSTKPTRAKMVS
jgi:hypothetical protein